MKTVNTTRMLFVWTWILGLALMLNADPMGNGNGQGNGGPGNGQGHGGPGQGRWNDRQHPPFNAHWIDSAQWVETSGTVIIDTLFRRDHYFLDTNQDQTADLLLNFGPWWYLPEGMTRPNAGETINVKGYQHAIPAQPPRPPRPNQSCDSLRPENPLPVDSALAVVELNGQIWRDSSQWTTPPDSGFPFRFNRDSLITVNGIVLVDSITNTVFPIYQLDIDNDNLPDYILGLGPRHRLSQAELPEVGSTIEIEGFTREARPNAPIDLPVLVVYKLNGQIWMPLNGRNNPDIRGNGMNSEAKLKSSCFPNPFNPTTTISYTLSENTQIHIEIFNLYGQWVRTLQNGYQNAGAYQVTWQGDNDTGQTVAAGTYFYVIRTDNSLDSRKILFLK